MLLRSISVALAIMLTGCATAGPYDNLPAEALVDMRNLIEPMLEEMRALNPRLAAKYQAVFDNRDAHPMVVVKLYEQVERKLAQLYAEDRQATTNDGTVPVDKAPYCKNSKLASYVRKVFTRCLTRCDNKITADDFASNEELQAALGELPSATIFFGDSDRVADRHDQKVLGKLAQQYPDVEDAFAFAIGRISGSPASVTDGERNLARARGLAAVNYFSMARQDSHTKRAWAVHDDEGLFIDRKSAAALHLEGHRLSLYALSRSSTVFVYPCPNQVATWRNSIKTAEQK